MTNAVLSVNTKILLKRVLEKQRRLQALKLSLSNLEKDIDYMLEDPESTIKEYMAKLREYNELKDIAMGLVYVISEKRSLKLSDILEEMEIEVD